MIGRMMIEKLYTCSFHHYAIAAASNHVFLHLAASIQRVHSADDYMQLDVQGRAGSGGRGAKNMRPIDADDFIERFSHTPMVQEALRIAMDKMGAIEPERKKGAWINEGRIIRCNKCKTGYAVVKGMKSALTYNFCPNCGADMRGEQDEKN